MSFHIAFDRDIPNIQSAVQSKGPLVIGGPFEAQDHVQVIGNVVTRTNTLILEHRDWLANQKNKSAPPSSKSTSTSTSTSTSASSSIPPSNPSPPESLITSPPSLEARQLGTVQSDVTIPGILPECSGYVTAAEIAVSRQFNASLISISSTNSVTSSTLAVALASATSALASVQLSALAALSTASASVQAAQSNASIAIVSARSSAAAGIAAAQSNATSSIVSVQSSASAAVSSANAIAASAQAAAMSAEASATLVINQASASVAQAIESATASSAASKVAAMNTTVLALTITFSILGSSILSILIVYCIARTRRRRRQARQDALKEKIYMRNSAESSGPSLSAFPLPRGRKVWDGGRERPDTVDTQEMINGPLTGSETLQNSASMPGSGNPLASGARAQGRTTWAAAGRGQSRQIGRQDMDFPFADPDDDETGGQKSRKTWAARGTIPEEGMRMRGGGGTSTAATQSTAGMRSVLTRKNTLTYDPEHPDRPPKFTTWLEESFRAVSPFPEIEGANRRSSSVLGYNNRVSVMPFPGQPRKSLMQRRRSKSMGEMSEVSEIGTAI